MFKDYYELNADFNLALLKKLLLEIQVPQEMEVRLGVPASRLEQWLHELADTLSDQSRPSVVQQVEMLPNHRAGILSAGEISLLLNKWGSTSVSQR